jgi:NAD(P)-dependent dehydrogenase (short-subunit alcohol dehydrogenase family)
MARMRSSQVTIPRPRLRFSGKKMPYRTRFHVHTFLQSGGGSGIGRILALRLASEGCKVIIWDIQKDLADSVVREIQAKGHQAIAYWVDLSNCEKVLAVAQQTRQDNGVVDIVINNAVIFIE